MRMDPRCKQLNDQSEQSHLLYRQLTETFLARECRTREFPESLCVGDYVFLNAVGETAEGCATMAEVARLLGINPSTATRQVNRLLADGLVTKSVAPHDDRRYEIRLTSSGRALLERMEDRLYTAIKSAYDNVSEEELQTVFRFMEKYNANLARLLEGE